MGTARPGSFLCFFSPEIPGAIITTMEIMMASTTHAMAPPPMGDVKNKIFHAERS
ncbi:MAG: hypothetical protein JEZ12_16185 [Desulfobacterium sp.]|nr:hypothetical protein [Desulfobacterium sp.]